MSGELCVRVVRMTLGMEHITHFQDLFDGWRHRILAFPGCRYLELLHDVDDPRVFLTYSEWNSPTDLENYRRSDVFGEVWPTVKELFAQPAQAWTVQREHRMHRTH